MFTINGEVDPSSSESSPKPILVNSPTLTTSILQQSNSENRKTFNSLKVNLQSLDEQQATLNTNSGSSNMDDFEIKQPIGYGSSAMVYSAIYIPHNKRVAIKVIDLDMFERNQIDELRRETSLMALSKHPNVLRVYGSFVHMTKLYIVTPYMSVGSCLDIMKYAFPDGLDEISIATILKQALEGLIYLHKNGHIHRDVKAGNLLMDQDGAVLLADFGVSSSLMETGERGMRKTFVGTPCWMAPEVMEQADYDYKADIWSFGITAIELATGHAPFAKHPPLKVLMMTLNNDPPTLDRNNTQFSKLFKEMIDSCMVKDTQKRPTAEKLLMHPFFKQAKKAEWLAKNLISDIPLIEDRPIIKRFPSHKKEKIKETVTADEWDFNENSNTNTNKRPGLHTPKRHISFGHVVVRKPSSHHQHTASDSLTIYNHHSHTNNIEQPTMRKTRALSDDFIVSTNDEIKKKNYHTNRTRHGSLQKIHNVTFSEDKKSLHRTKSHEDNIRTNGLLLSTESSLKRDDLYSSISSESRKIGRFELTHSTVDNSNSSSPYSTHSEGSSSTPNKEKMVLTQIGELIKQNESQKTMLNELFNMLEVSTKKSSQQDSIDFLEQQLQSYQRENLLLQRENDIMRKQIKEIKNSVNIHR